MEKPVANLVLVVRADFRAALTIAELEGAEREIASAVKAAIFDVGGLCGVTSISITLDDRIDNNVIQIM